MGAFQDRASCILPRNEENFAIAVAGDLARGKAVRISDQENILREIESPGTGTTAHYTEEGTYQLLNRWCGLAEQEKLYASESSQILRSVFDVIVSTYQLADAFKK
jgi:hypothetical protein